VGLNIKNQRVHELAREAARLRGTTQTGAIEEALEMLLRAHGADPASRRAQAKIDTAHHIIEAYAHLPANEPAIRRVEDLYDDSSGLPR
jgi:antitoxin VapB